MHKTKGNAIWFDDAAEQIGVDVMRWLYAPANPATNLNFGYGPGHEVVRRFFLPLWNSYSFFVTYARLDGLTPDQDRGCRIGAQPPRPLDPLASARAGRRGTRRPRRLRRTARQPRHRAFVDELSNWYVRRNRRRFWKSELDADKRAAYATLYEVLTTLCRLLAPIVPHLADAMWENLVVAVDAAQPDSVHLSDMPARQPGRSDLPVEAAVDLARRTVALGRSARSASGVRTRQPLRAVRVKLPGASRGVLSADPAVAAELEAQITDELNVRRLELIGDESEMVERSLYPLLPVLGPRHGKSVGAIMAGARSGEWTLNEDGSATVGGVTLQADEFELTARARPGHEVAEDGDLLVSLDTILDAELEAAGMAREVAHRLQALRREAGFEISDRVVIAIGASAEVAAQLDPHLPWLMEELLATGGSVSLELDLPDAAARASIDLDGQTVELAVRRA